MNTKYKVAKAVDPSLSCGFKLLSKFCIALNGANANKNDTDSKKTLSTCGSTRQVAVKNPRRVLATGASAPAVRPRAFPPNRPTRSS